MATVSMVWVTMRAAEAEKGKWSARLECKMWDMVSGCPWGWSRGTRQRDLLLEQVRRNLSFWEGRCWVFLDLWEMCGLETLGKNSEFLDVAILIQSSSSLSSLPAFFLSCTWIHSWILVHMSDFTGSSKGHPLWSHAFLSPSLSRSLVIG